MSEMFLQGTVGRQFRRQQPVQFGETFLKMQDGPGVRRGSGGVVESFGDELMPTGILLTRFHGAQQKAGHVRCHAKSHNIPPQGKARGDKFGGNEVAEFAAAGDAIDYFALVKEVDHAIDAGPRFEGIS